MSQLLQFFLLLPLAGLLVSLFFARKNERAISLTAIISSAIHLIGGVAFVGYWLLNAHPVLDSKHIVFFKSDHLEIFIDLYFDKVTAVYLLVGSALMLLVSMFSRYYIHRDGGFKQFFATTLLFFAAYNIVIFSGNFETLFLGWEILGVCSFLLITYYRDRYLPVKNGFKVISIYRLGDICLILVMWMSHQLWHENIVFSKWLDASVLQEHLQNHYWEATFVAAMIVLAAATKSAQFPFSSWLPRAMEGPTSSSAIFYGSLSVHIGAFLLLRTYPYWEALLPVKVLVIVFGLLTSLTAAGIARVQSSVKTQIAYSSTAQIGLIFCEIALGFHFLALIHFAGNAFLRTYQLLVSPSVLSYLVHDMVYNFKPVRTAISNSFSSKIMNTFYMLSVKEWNQDTFQFRFLWSPFKWIGRRSGLLSQNPGMIVIALLLPFGVSFSVFGESSPQDMVPFVHLFFAFIGLFLALRAFSERGNPIRAWMLVVFCQLFIVLAIDLYHPDFHLSYALIYLSGVLVAAVTGFICLKKMIASDSDVTLGQHNGHSYEHPVTAFVFLLSCLALAGLPFTPTFIGIDLLFSHIHKHEIVLVSVIALTFLFLELAVLRIYSRVFMGQHTKPYHPIAYKSS